MALGNATQLGLPFGIPVDPTSALAASQMAQFGGRAPSDGYLNAARQMFLGRGSPQLALGPGTPGGALDLASASGKGAANAVGGAGGSLESMMAQAGTPTGKAALEKSAAGGVKKLAEEGAAKREAFAKLLGPGGLAGLFEGAPAGTSGLRALLMSGGETGAMGGLGTLAGRVAVPLAGAQAASMAGHALTLGQHKGNWDEGLEGALTGGVGGALAGATIGAPAFGVGAIPGAIVGGIAGALGGGGLGLFGPKNTGEKAVASETKAQTGKLNKLLNTFGADAETRQAIALQFQMQASGAKSKSQVRDAYKQITSDPTLVQTISEGKRRKASMAAVQAWMGPAMQQALDRQQFYANAQGDAFDRIAGGYTDPNQAATTRAYGALARSGAADQAAAMMQQLALSQQLAGAGYSTGANNDGTQQLDLASILNAQPTS